MWVGVQASLGLPKRRQRQGPKTRGGDGLKEPRQGLFPPLGVSGRGQAFFLVCS